jgi:glycosyltransferase involved in cell wall biosynthesis
MALLLSTYPIVKPLHGGQIRLSEIRKAYERHGFKTVSIAVYDDPYAPRDSIGPHDIPLPVDDKFRTYNGKRYPMITDLLAGMYFLISEKAFARVRTMIPEKVDLVHLEQPFLLPLAELLKKDRTCRDAVFVFGSANDEPRLKRMILSRYEVGDQQPVIDRIAEFERKACELADVVFAVTRKELEHFSTFAPGRTFLAPNGTHKPSVDNKKLEIWRAKLGNDGWLLYSGSAYPPNINGFVESYGGSLGCIPPGKFIVIVGSMSEGIYRAMMQEVSYQGLNAGRLKLLFTIEREDLDCVKRLARGFIVPLREGAGSNLKTAEALYSGKPLIATPKAMEGFEQYIGADNVIVATSSESFRNATRMLYTDPWFANKQFEERSEILWENCLESAIANAVVVRR